MIKKAEEYIIEKDLDHWADQDYVKEDILKWIKQAQLDILEYAVKKCADNADADWEPMGWLADQHVNMKFIAGEDYEVYVNNQSILKTIDEIKEELK